MALITVISGTKISTLTVEDGTLISDILQGKSGAPHMFCGGRGTCGKCRVVAAGCLSPISAQEEAFLSPEELDSGLRLACLTRAVGDCSITLSQAASLQNISSSGYMPDFERKPMFKNYGAAVDIGTTTIVAQLYSEKGLTSTLGTHNPQRSFGADVISRIGKAIEGFGPQLAASVQSSIAEMLLAMTEKLPPNSLDSIVITGNTAMLYLLTGRDPDCLSHAPFEADQLFGIYLKAKDLGLDFCPEATVYLPRCMSAFVGADITTAALAAQLCRDEKSRFLVDIGTNGEMALWHDKRLLCCSTAAGPTFEGAGISMGMQGSAGAIDHLCVEEGKIKLHTIGGEEAKGICGSGIVDAVAAMLSLEAVDENGLMEEDEFPLSPKVSVNQKDIRMVQLAKSAICAGALTILEEAGLSGQELESFSIAGGFGSYLDLDKAAQIGLYPAALREKAVVLGNAALSGAAMILLNRDMAQISEALANSAETVELTTSPAFMDNYVECMMFE